MRIPWRLRSALLGLLAGFAVSQFAATQAEEPPAEPPTGEFRESDLQLATPWNPSIDPTGWWMSEKYDGLRAFWDGRKLWSRTGKPIHAPGFFLAELPPDVPLDGELWMGRHTYEETASTVLKQVPDERWKRVRYMIFDAPHAKGTFEERMQSLRALLPVENRWAKLVPHERCESAEHLIAERDRVVKAGGEGLMLRQPKSDYAPGPSASWLKVRTFDDAEATVIAHLPGKGKFTGKVGSLRVRAANGRHFSIGTGLTNAQRAAPPPVGTVITYRFRGVTARGLPRYPSFRRVYLE
jgi:DNA ligase-1